MAVSVGHVMRRFYICSQGDNLAIKRIGIASRCDRPEVLDMVREILARFSSQVQIFVSTATAEVLGIEGTPVERMRDEGVELVISKGVRDSPSEYCQNERSSPILGINMGTLGFLVDVELKMRLKP